MAWLYILQSKSTGRFYIGSTNELRRRISEHQRGNCLATRGRGPWELVYQETYDMLLEARRRELQVKKWKSAARIRELIQGKDG
jgi:putative endonuclease